MLWGTRIHGAAALGGGALIGLLCGCGGLGGSAAEAPTTSPAVSATASSDSASSTSSTKPPSPAIVARTSTSRTARFAFPIRATTSYGRSHHDYPATDIFAACGSIVVAPADGVISEVSRRDNWDRDVNNGADRGGLSYSMADATGVRYYGSHLRSVNSNIRPGVRVLAGTVIGRVGHTGDAADVSCHMHFGISPACGRGDWWIRRGTISPYLYLKAWQDGENLSPAATVADWKAKHGCSATPPPT